MSGRLYLETSLGSVPLGGCRDAGNIVIYQRDEGPKVLHPPILLRFVG